MMVMTRFLRLLLMQLLSIEIALPGTRRRSKALIIVLVVVVVMVVSIVSVAFLQHPPNRHP